MFCIYNTSYANQFRQVKLKKKSFVQLQRKTQTDKIFIDIICIDLNKQTTIIMIRLLLPFRQQKDTIQNTRLPR